MCSWLCTIPSEIEQTKTMQIILRFLLKLLQVIFPAAQAALPIDHKWLDISCAEQPTEREAAQSEMLWSSFGFLRHDVPPAKPRLLGGFFSKRLHPSDFYEELTDLALMEAIL